MSDGPGAGVEVAASAAREETGEQEQEQAAEPGASKTKFSSAGAKPPVAPTTNKVAPSASDLAFGEPSELPTAAALDPVKRFRTAIGKKDPAAIAIAGESPAAIGPLLTKEPPLAAKYFELVAANRDDAYREPLKALFPQLGVADKKKLFAAQFGFEIVEHGRRKDGMKEGDFYADQIDKMYEAALLLPPDHLRNNPRFKKLDAGMGATFHDRSDTIEMPSYPEASTGAAEKQYGKAFCHEVGHAVDFALGEKTNQLRSEFGWHVVNERKDTENLAKHFEELGMLKTGLDATERLLLADAMGSAMGGDLDNIAFMLINFFGHDKAKVPDLIARGVTPMWKERRGAFGSKGITIGDQHYFAAGFGMGGWAYKVNKATYDATPPMGQVSHYEWFAEWYATYYTQPGHAGVPGKIVEFFHDVVDPFNQKRSALGSPDAKEGTGGETPRFG